MTAYEAKQKILEVQAKKTVQRIFPKILKAVTNGDFSIRVNIGSSTKNENSLTEAEFEILKKDFGYKLEALYDDSGDHHKSDKKIAYIVIWE